MRDNVTALVNSPIGPVLFHTSGAPLSQRGRVRAVISRSILGGYLLLLDERQFTPRAVNCQFPV